MRIRCEGKGCTTSFESYWDDADKARAQARIKGWGVWPGLTTNGGQPAPNILCPACCKASADGHHPNKANRARGPIKPIEGQASLLGELENDHGDQEDPCQQQGQPVDRDRRGRSG